MSSIKRPPAVALAGLCVLALLAGCASVNPHAGEGARKDAQTPLDQYQVGTRETPDQLGLAVHREGLSASQHDALAAFVGRWRAAGGGTITLMTPSDAPDPEAARTFAMAAQSTLSVMGVPDDRIRPLTYAEGATPKPVVMLGFEAIAAVAPDCRSIPWENLSANKDNRAYNRFGCSLAANMAAQIADPRDLRGDTAMAPADNSRRMEVLSNYRTGKSTSTAKDAQANGAVSAAGQQ